MEESGEKQPLLGKNTLKTYKKKNEEVGWDVLLFWPALATLSEGEIVLIKFIIKLNSFNRNALFYPYVSECP